MKVYIYALVDPVTDLVRYVGKTVNPSRRFYVHVCDHGETHKARWIACLKRAGLKPRLEMLETINDPENTLWQNREKYWIRWMREEGYILTNVGVGGNGGQVPKGDTRDRLMASFTPERRAKIAVRNAARIWSEESKAKKRGKLSEEVRAKLRATFTPERRAKMSLLHKGKRVPAETVAKIAAAIRGTKWSEDRRAKIEAVWTEKKRTEVGAAQRAAGRKNTPETIAKMSASAYRREEHKRLAQQFHHV